LDIWYCLIRKFHGYFWLSVTVYRSFPGLKGQGRGATVVYVTGHVFESRNPLNTTPHALITVFESYKKIRLTAPVNDA
jgi:hypothetical protein